MNGYDWLDWNEKRLNRLKKLRAQGLTFEQIGKYFGVSRQRVHYLFRTKIEKIDSVDNGVIE